MAHPIIRDTPLFSAGITNKIPITGLNTAINRVKDTSPLYLISNLCFPDQNPKAGEVNNSANIVSMSTNGSPNKESQLLCAIK